MCFNQSHLGVDEERQNEHRQHQIRHRQTDDEVVGGGLQRLLREHAQTHQQIPADDHHDQQHPDQQGGQVVSPRRRLRVLHRRAQVGYHLRRGASAPSRSQPQQRGQRAFMKAWLDSGPGTVVSSWCHGDSELQSAPVRTLRKGNSA